MKIKHFCTMMSTAICLLPVISYSPAKSQPPSDYACFLTTASGNTVDFSQTSLCGAQKSAPKLPRNIDEAFLAEYKRNIMQYAEVRDNLLAIAEEEPEMSSSQAQKVCSDLKAGLSLEEIQQKQAVETVERSSMINAQIINSLATKYYCPNLSK